MEKFPDLNAEQIALTRAEYSTGIVLDENYKYATQEGQKVYTIFKDINSALEYTSKEIETKNNIEYYFHDKYERLVKYVFSYKK